MKYVAVKMSSWIIRKNQFIKFYIFGGYFFFFFFLHLRIFLKVFLFKVIYFTTLEKDFFTLKAVNFLSQKK